VSGHLYSIDVTLTRFVTACNSGTPELLISSVAGYEQGDFLLIREVKGVPSVPTGRTVCRMIVKIRKYPYCLFGSVKLGGEVIREQKESA
jgi:Na+/H+ antiporter NhaB